MNAINGVSGVGPITFEPRWSRDGRELFYRSRRRLYVVPVESKTGFSAGRPTPVADGLADGGYPATYSLSRDGRSAFFVKELAGEARRGRATLLLNWASEVERLTAK